MAKTGKNMATVVLLVLIVYLFVWHLHDPVDFFLLISCQCGRKMNDSINQPIYILVCASVGEKTKMNVRRLIRQVKSS